MGTRDVLILYGSYSGYCRGLSQRVHDELRIMGGLSDNPLPGAGSRIRVSSMSKMDPEDMCSYDVVMMVISTYSGGQAPPDAKFFCDWLRDAEHDVRVPKGFLSTVKFSVFGSGDRAYDEQFNLAALSLHDSMVGLQAMALTPPVLSDCHSDGDAIQDWVSDVWDALDRGHTLPGREAAVDVEDMGEIMSKTASKQSADMVTPKLRANLSKQGYKIIGSHSGVKMCRWTKAQLRGRGGCYKHTFYGITSYQCMEMTPSLACANKCVFCWRHQTNPVGTEWRWKQDAPEMILDGAIEQHRKMINQMKGVPGVIPERFQEAFNVRHCALSLVGEPIMYPEINTLVNMMHSRAISTFLVTNAQFPDLITGLVPVTQLYVSIDAADKDTLKEVDRPLFSDFWERFIGSLEAVKASNQRTVFRLTLLKGYNMDDVDRYARLVAVGAPCFIEVKGVTFCGANDKSDLTMQNVPFHSEVRDFCESLCTKIGNGDYELSCEHEHSCCVLIASTKFKVDGRWKTWINYDRFNELALSGEAFSPTDYAEETPSWAVYNDNQKGFDPVDTRFLRNKHKPRPTSRHPDGSAIVEGA